LKLSVCIQTPEIKTSIPVGLLSGSFEQKLEKAAALGYDAVELIACRPGELDVGIIRKQLRDVDLTVSAVGSGPVFMVDGLTLLASDLEICDRAQERLFDLLEFAAEVEAQTITIGSFRGRSGWYNAGDPYERLKKSLSKAAVRAYGLGIRIVLEPLNRYESDIINTTADALHFIEETGKSNIGVLLDTYHINIEEPSIYSCFVEAHTKKRMWHIHIGDSNRLPPGHGHMDFLGIAYILEKIGYRGFLSVELLPVPDPDTAAKETAQYLQQLITVVKKTGQE